MFNQVSTTGPVFYMGKPIDVQGIKQQTLENIPVANKLSDDTQRATKSLIVLASGSAIAPLLGIGLQRVTGPDGRFLRAAKALSDRTGGFDKWFNNLKLGDKLNKLLAPFTNTLANPNDLKLFKEAASSGSLGAEAKGIIKAAQTAKLSADSAATALEKALEIFKKGEMLPEQFNALAQQAKKASDLAKSATAKVPLAENTLKSLESINKMGIIGRVFGKTGLFLRKNLTGITGVLNGLFAAMTVNSVLQAKEGEKVSTLMEDVLGTWIGSMGGYRLFEAFLKGLEAVRTSGSGSGILLNIAKLVNKIPAKSFMVPLMGAMILSSVLQKVSHAIFGKPTKQDPKVIDSVESLQSWLQKTNWTSNDFAAVKASQGLPANPNLKEVRG